MRPDTPADPDDPADPTDEQSRVGVIVARLTDSDTPTGRGEQGRLLGSLSGALLGSARSAGRASVPGGSLIDIERPLPELTEDLIGQVRSVDMAAVKAEAAAADGAARPA